MVSLYPNPAQGFYHFDHMNAGLLGLDSMPPANKAPAASTSGSMMPSDHNYMKIRKPYTITKSRESWTEQEHDKFLEALHLFDRDWKKIEAYIGSKTVIQIRSHAQKYFQKVQKNGTTEHVPPPRPKRKAAHPYPQKAPKQAAVVSHATGLIQPSAALHEPAFVFRPDSSSVLRTPASGAALSSWSFDAVPLVPVAHIKKDDEVATRPPVLYNSCYSSSSESTPRTWPVGDSAVRDDQIKPQRGMPDFSKVYSFIGSVFDPEASGHLGRLRQMDPVDLETALLLMRNLSFNLASPEFEDIRKMVSSYGSKNENPKLWRSFNNIHAVKTESAISSV